MDKFVITDLFDSCQLQRNIGPQLGRKHAAAHLREILEDHVQGIDVLFRQLCWSAKIVGFHFGLFVFYLNNFLIDLSAAHRIQQ